eukprot:SAG22_NODE_3084_length_1955_cov_1.813578_3_plen_127_part_01
MMTGWMPRAGSLAHPDAVIDPRIFPFRLLNFRGPVLGQNRRVCSCVEQPEAACGWPRASRVRSRVDGRSVVAADRRPWPAGQAVAILVKPLLQPAVDQAVPRAAVLGGGGDWRNGWGRGGLAGSVAA